MDFPVNWNCLLINQYFYWWSLNKKECPNCGVADPNVPGVTNCISWLAYLQSVGQSAYAWCQDASNYQKCCISCQSKSEKVMYIIAILAY